MVSILLSLGLSVLANTFSFGGTDALGWTDSSSYEGSAYTASRVAATVARESLITAATLGVGTAARAGSAAARTAYKGVLATGAATGGYQIGSGVQQLAEGNYEAGALNVAAGGLRVAGSIAGAGAVAPRAAPHFSGTAKPWTKGATPDSIYTHIDPKTGKAVQNAIYDSQGNVIGHVDFGKHGLSSSGHGHTFPPGQPGLGHGAGTSHIPNNQLPPGWGVLPPGVQPRRPIGQ